MLKTVVHQFFLCFFLTQQDGSGTITIKEFEKGFHVETTKALFEALGLKAEDAWTLFRSLDKDGGKKPNRHHHFSCPGQQLQIYKRTRQGISWLFLAFVRSLVSFGNRPVGQDGDHRIGETEFVQGCINTRGPARQVDLRSQAQQNRRLEQRDVDGVFSSDKIELGKHHSIS
jgi:hypothetical protein